MSELDAKQEIIILCEHNQLYSNSFAHCSAFKAHTRIHKGEEPFSCTLCPMPFARRGHMKVHSRIYTGETELSCSLCETSFGNSSELMSHLRIHTGEKPFSFTLCPLHDVAIWKYIKEFILARNCSVVLVLFVQSL